MVYNIRIKVFISTSVVVSLLHCYVNKTGLFMLIIRNLTSCFFYITHELYHIAYRM